MYQSLMLWKIFILISGMNNGIIEVKCIRSIQGFVKGESYTFKLFKSPNEPYQLEEVETKEYIMLSSEASINRYFKIENEDSDSDNLKIDSIKKHRGRPKKNVDTNNEQ